MSKQLLSLLTVILLSGATATVLAEQADRAPLWESEAVLASPENVILDKKRQRLYVSSINGKPDEKNAMGFISSMSLDGKIIELEMIKGLNAPKGMEIHEDVLYVSDIDQLVAIDLEEQRIIARYAGKGAKFLNDVVADKDANIYVSDMMGESIYRLQNGRLDRWLQNPELQAPNGLIMDKGKLVVGGWGVLTEGFGTSTLGHLKTVDLNSKAIRSLGDGTPIANIDGLRADGKGQYLITNWMTGGLFRVSPDGSIKNLLKLSQGSADIEYLSDKNIVLIPMMLHNTVRAYSLPD